MNQEIKQIAIIEDNSDFALAMQQLINNEVDMRCDVIFENPKVAIADFKNYCLDFCLVDIQLPLINGIELIYILKKIYPKIYFVICSLYDDDNLIFDALKYGADGFILKSDDSQKIIENIRNTFQGNSPLSSIISKKILTHFKSNFESEQRLDDLTITENEILQMLSTGLLYKEIAEIKNVTIDTIKKHCGNIYKKLHVGNKTEALNILHNKNNH